MAIAVSLKWFRTVGEMLNPSEPLFPYLWFLLFYGIVMLKF